MVISYSCFHFAPKKYYKLAASDGHCQNRLLILKLSALKRNVGPRRQPDHSCRQLRPINSKHQAHRDGGVKGGLATPGPATFGGPNVGQKYKVSKNVPFWQETF